jgi:hypothetical protein
MPTVRTVHVNVPLTNLAIQYKFPPIVADKVFPVVKVNKESDVYYKFLREELIDLDAMRAPGTEANEVEWDVTTEAYKAEEYALKYLLPDRVETNADEAVRPRQNTTMKLTRWLQLGWEIRVKNIVTDPTIITNTSGVSVKWDAASGATPEKDVDTAKKGVYETAGVEPNTMLLNKDSADALKRWLKLNSFTDFRDFLAVGELPPTLWNLEIIIGKSVYNSAKRGQPAVIGNIWPDSVLIYYKEASPSLETFSLGYTLRSRDFRVKDWREEGRDGQYYETSVIQDEVLVAADAAYLITDVLT